MKKQSFYLVAVGLAIVACSESNGGPANGTGGTRDGSGGAQVSGGANASGGSTSAGGKAASGGAISTGGRAGSGGAGAAGTTSGGTSTGGASSGGANPGGATMGGAHTGGASAGGANTGGVTIGGANTGGVTIGGANTGGASTGGNTTAGASTGGASTGGATASGDCVSTPLSEMIGWATQAGATTGGSGTPVVATTLAQLNGYLDESITPQIIHVKGAIDGEVVLDGTANKTIIGCGATLRGNIMMEEAHNIIIQNLKIVSANPDSGGDLITLDNQTHHVWLDHLDLSDGADGNMDIVHGSDYVTVSWTKFSYTALPAVGGGGDSGPGEHQFATLIGHSNDNSAEDTGRLRVTFHHCFWGNNVKERMPRVRYGQVHLLNNLIAASGGYETTYAIRAGVGANVRSEGNIFKGIMNPFDFGDSDAAARLESIGDVLTDCTGTTEPRGPAFSPPYPYTVEPTADLEARIRAGAGVR